MLTESIGRSDLDHRADRELLLDTTIRRYRSAVERLMRSFVDRQPVGIVVSDGRFAPAHVVCRFLELIADDADVCTVTGQCSNATAFMREIIEDIGFTAEGLSLNDLEGVLELFLQHQRRKKRRTVIAVQEFHAHGWWVLDKIRRLIEVEAEEKNGLMLVLTGPPSATALLNEPILDVIATHAGDRVILEPFSLSETRDFVRRHVASTDVTGNSRGDSGQIVEFFATNLIHEICSGIPDDIYRMCKKCLEILDCKADNLISVDTVREAASLMGLEAPPAPAEDNAETAAGIDETVLPPGRLLIKRPGQPVEEYPLAQSSIVVGRDRLCDICISGLKASRFHALFSVTEEGLVVADLDSTNGTTVNGKPIGRYVLDDKDIVSLGGTRISYAAGGECLTASPGCPANGSRVDDDYVPEPSINFVGEGLQLLKTS
jgi:type II secretory pathway predicted ATPase ExeA